MTERYAIADWLTDDEKRRAIESEYAPAPSPLPGAFPRDPNGYCPLGRAIDDPVATEPGCAWFADALARRRGQGFCLQQWNAICGSAGKFMADWDAGAIPADQLPIALGLVEPTK